MKSSRSLTKCVIILMSITVCFGFSIVERENNHESSVIRSKRGLFYPWLLYPLNAATGYLVAIAIPVAGLDRSVFVSFNFEANYNMPNIPSDSYPGPPLVRWQLGGVTTTSAPSPDEIPSVPDIARKFDESEVANSTIQNDTISILEKSSTKNYQNEDKHEEIHKRSLLDSVMLTRKGVYRIIESRLTS